MPYTIEGGGGRSTPPTTPELKPTLFQSLLVWLLKLAEPVIQQAVQIVETGQVPPPATTPPTETATTQAAKRKREQQPPSLPDIAEICSGDLLCENKALNIYGGLWYNYLSTADAAGEIDPYESRANAASVANALENEYPLIEAVRAACSSDEAAWGLLFALPEDVSGALAQILRRHTPVSTPATPVPYVVGPSEQPPIALIPQFLPGTSGRYGQGVIVVPSSMFDPSMEHNGSSVTVDVFVPAAWQDNADSRVWETISQTNPAITAIPGGSVITQSLLNGALGGESQVLVVPARVNEDNSFVFWDRDHFEDWQENAHKYLIFSNLYDSPSLGIYSLPATYIFAPPRQNSNIPAPNAVFPLVDPGAPPSYNRFNPSGMPAWKTQASLFALATAETIAADYHTATALRNMNEEVESHLPYNDAFALSIRIQRTEEEGAQTQYRAIIYAWQYATVAEPDFSHPGSFTLPNPLGDKFTLGEESSFNDAPMIHAGIGSYIGSEGVYPAVGVNLSGYGNQHVALDGSFSIDPASQFMYWNWEEDRP